MSELPEGWASALFGEINSFVSRTLNPSRFGDEIFELFSVPSFLTRKPEIVIGKGIGSAKQVIESYDVLVCKINPRINRVWQVTPKREYQQIASSEWIVMRSPELDAGYLTHYFSSPEFRRMICAEISGVGGSLTRVQPRYVAKLPVKIPPLKEQKRIADKLDSLLARVDTCRDRLKNIPSVLKNFRYSVLNAAISGELTNDWRLERNRSLDSWQEKNGREVFAFITSGSRGWSTYYSNHGSIFLRVGNLDHATIDLDLRQIQYVNPPVGAEGKRTRIEVGDILISITADVGMVALIREDIGEAYINQHLCLARQTGEYLGAYLAYFLASPLGGFAQLTEMQRGVTKSGLTLGDIRSVKFLIPDLDEQQEIVNRIESLFSYANYCDLNYQKAYAILENLTPIILDKAFCGELVSQDPNDEPASILLERIHTERIANPSILQRDLITRKPKMPKMTNESVKKIIDELPSDAFSFENLHNKLSGDYDSFKDILFELLDEDEPSIEQMFDKQAKAMHFIRKQK